MADYWPNGGDYLEAVQNPAIAFKDAKLKVSKAQTNRMGLPRTRAGALASVYKFESPAGSNAVRVFLTPDTSKEDRRQTVTRSVSGYLKKHRPSSMVGFDYQQEGIRVREASGSRSSPCNGRRG